MKLSIVLLAKDEERTIGSCLRALWQQHLFRDSTVDAEVLIVPNGCTDRTAAVAEQTLARLDQTGNLKGKVHNLAEGGKSRAWNIAVHELMRPESEFAIFVDCDCQFVGDSTLSLLFTTLAKHPAAVAVSGYPLKEAARSASPSLVQRFSLAASRTTRHSNAICGQLYLVRRPALDEIWLPLRTPGEDGFLNAMLNTRGFSRQPVGGTIVETSEPTHYFENFSPADFVTHETRLIVGTMVNIWLFEYLWSLKATTSLGPTIARWNQEDPDWADRVIQQRAREAGRWVIRSPLMFRRLTTAARGGGARILWRLPIGIAATLLTLPPAVRANRLLKQRGATGVW